MAAHKSTVEDRWLELSDEVRACALTILEETCLESKKAKDFDDDALANMEMVDEVIDLFGSRYSAMVLLKSHDEGAYDEWLIREAERLQEDWIDLNGTWWPVDDVDSAIDEAEEAMEEAE